MKGAVAAGSLHTAQAAIEILHDGGNAVDAAVAATLAMSAGEPALTGLAGGGIMVYHDSATKKDMVCDFFADAPLADTPAAERDFSAMELDFGPATQVFHIGRGSGAVPGVIPGLFTALEQWGKLPAERVAQPACRMMREGTPFGKLMALIATVVGPIVTLTDKGRKFFAPEGELLKEGQLFINPQQADTLEAIARGDWRKNYRGLVCEILAQEFGPAKGGLLTMEALDAYRVIMREPVSIDYRGHAIRTCPPPASGGQMITMMLTLLETIEMNAFAQGSKEHIHALCRAMKIADYARATSLTLESDRRELHEAFTALEGQPLSSAPPVYGGPPNTSHLSVVDSEGNAAAVTTSHGEGNGIFIGDTGIMMNNLMGEEDLFPGGFDRWTPGQRLSTMMSPTIVTSPDGTVTVLGTGGANRIRTAITQVVSALVDYGLTPEEAVHKSRVHFEAGVLNVETFDLADDSFLPTLGAPKLVPFPEPNLFFGGVHMVRRGRDDSLEGAGDKRRGGVFMTTD